MQTLLAKDLRLAGDVLRPALLILVGFVVGLTLLSAVPESILPLAGSLSITDLLYGLPSFLLVASGPFALVATATTLRGDRRHGATLLAGSLPVSAARQGASALVVLLVVTAILPLLTAILLAIRMYVVADVMASREFTAAPPLALVAGACGTAYGLAASRPGRSPAWTVAFALGLIAAFAISGAAAGWIAIMLEPGLRSMGWTVKYDAITNDPILQIGAISAVVGGAIGSALVGIPHLLGFFGGTRRRRVRGALVALTFVVAIAASLAGVRGSIASSETFQNSSAYHSGWIARLSPDELAASVRALQPGTFMVSDRSRQFRVEDRSIALAASDYARKLPLSAWPSDPVIAALRVHENFASETGAVDTLNLVVPRHDPRYLALALDAIRRYPDSMRIQVATVFAPEIVARWSLPPTDSIEASRAAVEATLRTALETLIREGHPESERMKAVLDVLPATATTP